MTEERPAPEESGEAGGGTVEDESGRGWLRAVGLFFAALAISVFPPSVLVAIPFLALVAVFGMHGLGTAILAALAMVVAVSGSVGQGMWWVERAWTVLVAGLFTALTLRRPGASLTTRAMTAVSGAAGILAVFLVVRPEAWGVLDWMIRERMGEGIATALEAIRLVRGGEAVPTSLMTAVWETVELQARLFPATVALASMAGLAVAWWGYRRLGGGGDEGLAPLVRFRFNDHLVWLFIGGLVLAVTRWSEVLARVGENLVTFMGALYALRGAAVVLFMSGGLSFLGWLALAVGLLFVSPLVLTGAMVVGIGDTWLDVRARLRDAAA